MDKSIERVREELAGFGWGTPLGNVDNEIMIKKTLYKKATVEGKEVEVYEASEDGVRWIEVYVDGKEQQQSTGSTPAGAWEKTERRIKEWAARNMSKKIDPEQFRDEVKLSLKRQGLAKKRSTGAVEIRDSENNIWYWEDGVIYDYDGEAHGKAPTAESARRLIKETFGE